jgi:hypothetical protein
MSIFRPLVKEVMGLFSFTFRVRLIFIDIERWSQHVKCKKIVKMECRQYGTFSKSLYVLGRGCEKFPMKVLLSLHFGI